MKVICIDDTCHTGKKHPYLKFGAYYMPDGETKNMFGEDCYIISCMPPTYNAKTGKKNDLPIYKKTRFIPLSDIDETQLIEQSLTEIK